MPGPDTIATPELLDALPMAVVLADRSRRVVGWNAAAEALYGHDRGEVLGSEVVTLLFDEDDQPAIAARFDAAMAGGAWEGDARVRRSDGAFLVSSFRLANVGDASAWIATDGMDQGLAEQERSVLLSAERAARATAEEALGLFEAILGSAPLGIAVFDLDLQYARVNDAYAAVSGMPAEDHAGLALGGAVPLHPEVAADLRRVVTTGRTTPSRAIDVPDGSGDGETPAGPGRLRSFTVSCFPVRTASGVLVGAGLTLTEITEARRAEAERLSLLRQAEAAHQRLSILAMASTVLSSTMDIEELLNRLSRVLTPAAADWCVIQLLGHEGVVQHVAVSHHNRAAADELATALRAHPLAFEGTGPVAQVMRTGQALLVTPEAMADALRAAASDRRLPSLASRFSIEVAAVVPIEIRSERLGVLILSCEGGRSLDDDDLDLAVEIAHRTALAVSNARAYQQEHQIAESLQRALLPATAPAVAGLELAVRYVAATDGASVGGDWYDVLPFDDGATGLVVGDIVGHDIAASTSMGQLRSTLRAYAYEDHGAPGDVLARVDRLSDTLGLPLATCVFGVFEPSSSTFRWSNAGHPPPMLVRDGQVTFLDQDHGMLLGVSAGEGMTDAATEVRDGDVLVLYTDGLVERRGESLQVGLARLAIAAQAAEAQTTTAEGLCDALVNVLLPSTSSREDDVALLVVRLGAEPEAGSQLRLELAASPESVAVARGFVAGALQSRGWYDEMDTAVLLTSELVTNAIRHAGGPCAVAVSFADLESVEVSVEDDERRHPVVRRTGGLDESGRGLVLVDAMAARWGTRAVPGGKATWFTLRKETGRPDGGRR